MKKRIISLLIILMLLVPTAALAARQYIVPDSNTRKMTVEELWEWNYESLGFIFNEIFARHGYNFIVGQKYYNYFMDRPWYTPNQNPNNKVACYPQMNSVEWYNEKLCKEVRADMRAKKTTNPGGKNYINYIEAGFDALSGFDVVKFKANQKFSVYSAPSYGSYRGANGKASVSTNGAIYVAGWESDWLLVMYMTDKNGVRVGYVNRSEISGAVNVPMLNFEYDNLQISRNVTLTDDPATSSTAIVNLYAGDDVLYLAGYQNRYDWAYIETSVNGLTVRGFVPSDALGMDFGYEENEETNSDNWK